MHYCFDLDGTICSQANDYAFAEPFRDVIHYMRELRRQGHEITIFTARGSGTGKEWRDLTEAQLDQWGVPYDNLVFGKPPADVYIDDRAINAKEWRGAINE